MATFRMRLGLRNSDPNPRSSRSRRVRFGARCRVRRSTINCCLSRRFPAFTARTPPTTTQLRGHDGQMEQREQQILHARDSVGQTSGTMQRCSPMDSAREWRIRDPRARKPPRRHLLRGVSCCSIPRLNACKPYTWRPRTKPPTGNKGSSQDANLRQVNRRGFDSEHLIATTVQSLRAAAESRLTSLETPDGCVRLRSTIGTKAMSTRSESSDL